MQELSKQVTCITSIQVIHGDNVFTRTQQMHKTGSGSKTTGKQHTCIRQNTAKLSYIQIIIFCMGHITCLLLLLILYYTICLLLKLAMFAIFQGCHTFLCYISSRISTSAVLISLLNKGQTRYYVCCDPIHYKFNYRNQ